MNKQDLENMFKLLMMYYPAGGYTSLGKTERNAWLLVMEPYSKDAVKSAILSHIRSDKGGFNPKVSDITRWLTPPEEPHQEKAADGNWMREASDWVHDFLEADRKEHPEFYVEGAFDHDTPCE